MKKKICFLTTSRADFGIIKNLCIKLNQKYKKNFFILATGSHLSKKFGYTLTEVKKYKFNNLNTIKISDKDKYSYDISRASSELIKKISSYFKNKNISYLIVLGDRFETFISCYVANLFDIKIIHISGGDITSGSKDDIYRHSISLMANFSIVTNILSKKKLISLGLEKKNIFNLGHLSCDNLKNNEISKEKLEKKFKIKFNKFNFLITFHPETKNGSIVKNYLLNCFKVLKIFKDTSLIFTASNQDLGGSEINILVKKFVKENPSKAFFVKSFGVNNYFSLLSNIHLVLGNSSSAICEVPSYHIGSLNIGNRQKGRYFSKSVVNSSGSIADIKKKIKYMLSKKFLKKIQKEKNFYMQKNSLKKYYLTLNKILK